MEYALEAIKQGSATVGLVSKSHAVLVALKRNAEELGSYQKKILDIDTHMGLALAGLAPDARLLCNHLRTLSLQNRMIYDRPLSVAKAVSSIADKAQTNTQQYGRRPYGVGLLVVGYDETGPHLFEFLPSGSMLEYVGSAIGARSQAARTYLERNVDEFEGASLEELIVHGLTALRDTLPQDKELTFRNTSIAVVGKDQDFKILEDEDVSPWLDKLDSTSRVTSGGDVDGNEDGQDAGATSETAAGEDAAEPTQSSGEAGSRSDVDIEQNRMDES